MRTDPDRALSIASKIENEGLRLKTKDDLSLLLASRHLNAGNFLAAGSNPLLETRINRFEVKDLSPSEALDELLNLPELQANMTALKLKRRAPDVSPAKLRSSRFSVNLEGVTLREALNKIAQQPGIGIWIFHNYPNGFFSISSVES